MAVTLVLNFQEGLLRQTGEDNEIVHYIDLTAANINEPTTHRVSQNIPAITQMQRRQSNSNEIVVESQKICSRRVGHRMRSQPRRRSREMSRGRSRSNTRERSRGRSRGHSRGRSRGHSRGRSRGHSRGRSRGHSRGRSRGHSRGRSRGHSRGRSRGHSRGRSRGNSRGHSRDRPQGRSKGCSERKFRNHCRCQKECYLRRNSTFEENHNYSRRHEKCNSI